MGSIIPYRPQPTRVFFIAHVKMEELEELLSLGFGQALFFKILFVAF